MTMRAASRDQGKKKSEGGRERKHKRAVTALFSLLFVHHRLDQLGPNKRKKMRDEGKKVIRGRPRSLLRGKLV